MNIERQVSDEVAEQHVLGGVFFSPDVLGDLDGLTAGEFFVESHRRIFGAMSELAARHEPIDVITVHSRLAEAGMAEAVGGIVYLNDLAQCVASAANVRRYAGIVRRHALTRRCCEAIDISRNILLGPGDAVENWDRVVSLIAAVQGPVSHVEPPSLGAVLLERSQYWIALEEGSTHPGMLTHLPTFDNVVGGLQLGKLIVIAARPSVGKTALALQILLGVASDGHSVLLFSQEMSAGDMADRAAANLGRVKLGTLRTGRFEDGDWARVTEAAEAAARLPIYIDETPALTLLDIRAKARRVKQRHGLKVIAIDYLQLMGAASRQESRHHQIEAISRGLKQLAKELEVCVLLLSQVNRQSTQRADGEPTLADLKESGAIEEDADVVCVLHPKGSLSDGSMLIAGILLKNRQGRRGRIAFSFNGSTQRWCETSDDVSSRGAA